MPEMPSLAHILCRPTDQQQHFLDAFLTKPGKRVRLSAPPGSGKTLMAARAAVEAKRLGIVDALVFVSFNRRLSSYWQAALAQLGWPCASSAEALANHPGMNVTLAGSHLQDDAWLAAMSKASSAQPTLVIVDESHDLRPSVIDTTRDWATRHPGSRYLALFLIFDAVRPDDGFFDSDYLLDPWSIIQKANQREIVRLSPSHSPLKALLDRTRTLDDLPWRDFEKLIAELLERDRYTVELMRGTKDGGVDVIATLDLGPAGHFKTLWQAKKRSTGRKLGISVVRELADTRQEFGASKAIVVTTSYLSRDAIRRIERDRYLLGKVDRDDMDAWIARRLAGSGRDMP